MPIEDMSFVELDALREGLRLPQAKLCQKADLNPTTYSRWRKWARGEQDGSEPQSRSLKAVRDVLRQELASQRSPRPLGSCAA